MAVKTTRPPKSKAEKGPKTSRKAKGKKAVVKAKTKTKAAARKAGAAKNVKRPLKAAKSSAKKTTKASKPKSAPALVEGAMAPDFDLPRDGGDSVSLSSLKGRKVVLFFYPRADTPGCTREAIDFTRLTPQFEAADTTLLGMSADPVKAQDAFRDKHSLCTPLLSDEAHGTLGAYGAWGEKSMYGKTFEGVLRTTVLIGRDGRIAKVWRSVSVDGHADQVLAAAREL
jgi:peroxiredoxin Q/BCP